MKLLEVHPQTLGGALVTVLLLFTGLGAHGSVPGILQGTC